MKEYVYAPKGYEKFDAVEIARDTGTVTLRLGIGNEFTSRASKPVVQTLQLLHGEPHGRDPVLRPCDEISRRWNTSVIPADDEAEAVRLLRRKYAHVIVATSTSDLASTARGLMEREYRDDVDEMAASIKEWIDEDPDRDRDDFLEYVHETLDGCYRVTYTTAAQECLLFSDNDGRAFDEGLIDSSAFKSGIPWSALAYAAFEADVLEALEHLGVDVNDDDLGRPPVVAGFAFQGDTFCGSHVPCDMAGYFATPLTAGTKYECAGCGDVFRAADPPETRCGYHEHGDDEPDGDFCDVCATTFTDCNGVKLYTGEPVHGVFECAGCGETFFAP